MIASAPVPTASAPSAQPFLPYARHQIAEDDIAAVVDCLRGDWLSGGPAVPSLETALREQTGAPEAVVCASGTAALHLAYASIGVAGKAVLVPAITFAATANAVRYAGGTPIFADVDPRTGHLTAATLRDAVARAETRGLEVAAASPVSLTGQAVDLETLGEVAGSSVRLVEDAAHSLGASLILAGGQRYASGSCRQSDAAIFSFHPVKSVCAGEGGAVLLRDPEAAARLRRLRDHGMQRGIDADRPWRMAQTELGYHYRMSDLQATLGRSQLAREAEGRQRRREIAQVYLQAFREAPFADRLRLPFPAPGHAWHLFVVHFADSDERDAAWRYLRAAGIGSQVHYLPVYQHPDYKDRCPELPEGGLPGAEAWFEGCLSLPIFAGMTDADRTRVIATLADFLTRR